MHRATGRPWQNFALVLEALTRPASSLESIASMTSSGPAHVGRWQALLRVPRRTGEAFPRGAVIVVQEIFGVNHHIRAVADASPGWATSPCPRAVRPRAARRGAGVRRGRASPRGGPSSAQLGWDAPIADIQATVTRPRTAGRVGVVGYCWGGSLAFLSAVQVDGIACAVGYYGDQIAARLDPPPRVPVMLHFGEQDSGIPLPTWRRFAAPSRRRRCSPTRAPGTASAATSGRASSPPSAALARERTLAFLREHVG